MYSMFKETLHVIDVKISCYITFSVKYFNFFNDQDVVPQLSACFACIRS